ncbi:MAG: class I SAM-dependent methyltransferase [Magnetococcales bacterium]|nr:class I SAM-dependent methyltransferase [Magnetococcales bacterium]
MRGKLPLAAGTGKSVPVECCQVCHGKQLESILFLGYLPPVNQMRTIGETPFEQPSYPAELLYCPECDLVQIGLIVDPEVLFPPEYPYTSGTTRILHQNFQDLAEESRELLGLTEKDLIVDVGSNDGTLLSKFESQGHKVYGIEPTDAGQLARDRGIETMQSFFTPEAARKARKKKGAATLVTAANCFAHIENIHSIVEGVLELLPEDGVFVNESHYLIPLLDTLQYDTIYHEHLRYYSVTSLKNLLESHGLELIHVKAIPSHGGSVRVYAARKGKRPIQPSVNDFLTMEQDRGPMVEQLNRFKQQVVVSKLNLMKLLAEIKAEGGRIIGISAPSRASTMTNYVGLDDGLIDYVVEIKGSRKIGKLMPGKTIPVIEESRMFDEQPEYALLFSWHIADELMPKLRSLGYKGSFIVPLPEPRIVEV